MTIAKDMNTDRQIPDGELVEMAKAGDQTAYGAIFNRYEKALRTRIASICSRKADVDDVLTESFQKFFSRMDSFDTGRDLLPWLYTIATRTALDHLDAMRREDEKNRKV